MIPFSPHITSGSFKSVSPTVHYVGFHHVYLDEYLDGILKILLEEARRPAAADDPANGDPAAKFAPLERSDAAAPDLHSTS